MQIFNRIEKTEYNTSVALGFFDGVHIGHRSVISNAVVEADENIKSVVVTFQESPHTTLTGAKKPLLTTNEKKFKLFEQLGVDIVYCIDFNDIKDMTAQEFVDDILCDKLHALYVTTGFNYRFSKGGKADTSDLKKLCAQKGIAVYTCLPVMHGRDTVSSSRIRECIKNGDVESANSMLGYNFSISGTVVQGNHIGTKIETPTINQPLNDALVVPRHGVYASRVIINNHSYMGATNIGTHPTVGGKEVLCETHLLNFDGTNLYNKKVSVQLLRFIREEKKFDSINALKKQIELDKSEVLTYHKK